ncbi:hypothetical protein [Devosia sp. RR2S18]|uniref:hypothetical protein n=1 Tax=Devosia rhizosphaerae TaxID=3049774 RepID=UPI0025406765|nr:hypothetical protein [Devosia sp. RR2S18]WIJ27024.1 hypothetical protein QOV41_09880 [Devosia sp. RR2S18]
MSSVGEKFRSYHASKKALFWYCAGSSVLTMIVGFSFGGWVTGGTAAEQAKVASERAVASVAGAVCFEKFMASPDAYTNLVALKAETTARKRNKIIDDGGWTILAGETKATRGAAELCGELLAAAELPDAPPAVLTPVAETDEAKV